MHHDDDDDDGVDQRPPEIRIAQDFCVVGEADEGWGLSEGGLVQAEPDDLERRQEDDAADHELDRADQSDRAKWG
jgi:hypothetical protein